MLPKNLAYGSKVNSASARSKRSNISCQNGTNYNEGETIIINIPTRANEVLATTESYIRGTLQLENLSGQNASFRFEKCGIHGLFSRIRVYHGSNLLEDTQNYGNLAAMLYDVMMPGDCVENKNNVLTGSRSTRVTNFATIATETTPAASDPATTQALANALRTKLNTLLSALNNQVEIQQRNSGSILGASIANNGTTNTFDFAVPLISIVGTLCSSQYLPLFALQSAPIRVEIDLVNNLQESLAIASTGTNNPVAGFILTNVEYVAQIVELSDDAISKIRGSLNGPLQFVIPQYKNSTGSVVAGRESIVPLPFRFTSLKSIFVTSRQDTGARNRFPFSSISSNITSYQFRVGSSVFPQKAPQLLTEMFAECVKAMGGLSDLQFVPAITRDSYIKATNDTLNITTDPNINIGESGSFYIGIDMESYSNANKESIFAGFNTNTTDVYFNATYSADTTLRYDFYAMYDALFVAENNVGYVSV